MANVFIFHGTEGYPEENWFPWLKQKLEHIGHEVIVPQFPTPKGQTLENWFDVFKNYSEWYTHDSILVGHSLGGAFLLRVLEKYDVRIKAAFMVAAPIGVLPIINFEGDQSFIGKPFDWKGIRDHCGKFFVFHSDNDPYVSLGNGKLLAEKLGTKLLFMPNCGHFNKSAGFTEFEDLFKEIKGNCI